MGPTNCTKCGQLQKLSFNEWYCDCDISTNRNNSVLNTCEKLAHSLSSLISRKSLMRTGPIIGGVQMTHCLECRHCHQTALYIDHDPLSHPGKSTCEIISKMNGYFQRNHTIVNGNPILCDKCSERLHPFNFQLKYLHKY